MAIAFCAAFPPFFLRAFSRSKEMMGVHCPGQNASCFSLSFFFFFFHHQPFPAYFIYRYSLLSFSDTVCKRFWSSFETRFFRIRINKWWGFYEKLKMRLQRIVRFLKIVFGRVPLRIVLPIFFAGLVTHFWKRYSDRLPRVLLNQEDSRMRSILNRCSLLSQCYSPTLWCNFPWPQMIVLVLWERLRRNSVHFVEETVRTPDLGTVELHWVRGFEPSTLPSYNSSVAQSASLPDNAPVVVFLHTLTGDSRTHCSFVAYALERGWRPVVFSRRGHSVLLSTPKFNLFGDVDDTALMVQRVRAHYPHAFIGYV